jgi:NhaP-type Na+/H+ or K+/H+ antiporter
MIGSGMNRPSLLFVAWFGPRGLASVVFALLAIELLGDGANEAVAVVVLTVLLSVVLHGVTAGPAGRRMARNGQDPSETAPRARSDAFHMSDGE